MKTLLLTFFLSSFSYLNCIQHPTLTKSTKWKFIQGRHLSDTCFDTTRIESWKENKIDIESINIICNIKGNFLIESGSRIQCVDEGFNGKKFITADGLIKGNSIYIAARHISERTVCKIVKRTNCLLVLSSSPGSFEVYQNTQCAEDSLSKSTIIKYIAITGVIFKKKITYCSR